MRITLHVKLFLLIFSKDYKQAGIGIEVDRFLVNKDFIKATEVHFSEIQTITQDEHSIEITLKDYTKLIECQPLLFRVFARKKFIKKKKPISFTKSDFEDNKGNEVYDFIKSKMR